MASAAAPVMPTGLPGRLLAMSAAAAVLVAVLTGNLFALHAGMTTSGSPAAHAAVTVDEPVHGIEAATGAGHMSPMPADAGAQQTMHLVGACLTVLATAVLFALALLGRGVPAGGYPAAPAVTRLWRPMPAGVWRPPPLTPPVSSPVIRT